MRISRLTVFARNKGLLPNESLTVDINSGGIQPLLTIESDRLVTGQKIQFEADL
jgi:hypothetical protein